MNANLEAACEIEVVELTDTELASATGGCDCDFWANWSSDMLNNLSCSDQEYMASILGYTP